MIRPKVIVDPAFRRMDEIFDEPTRDRLFATAEIAWARDEPMPTASFLAEVATADAVVFGEWRHGGAGLDAVGDRLVALLEVAGGHEHVGLDYRQALDRGIRIGSCAPAFGPVVAEMGLALALASVRGVAEADRAMRSRSEAWLHEGNSDNTTLLSATVGFVGCGGISHHLQALLEPFDVTVLGYDPPQPASVLRQRGIVPASLEIIFDEARVVFVLAAPNPGNRGLIDARLLERLGPGRSLVVLSRGSLVDFDAATEIATRRGFRLATDVYPVEPLPGDHQLRDCSQALMVPHLAGALPQALHAIGSAVVDDLQAIFEGGAPTRMQYLDASNAEALLQVGADESGV